MLAYLTFFFPGHAWKQATCKPIAISVLLCAAFSVFEILSRYMGIATGVYAFLDGIVHGGLNAPTYVKGWDPRIRSLAFEPPAFGLYASFAWPWLMAGWVSSHGRARRGYAVVWVVLDNPVFGIGLGQYGFYLGKYLPPWGHLSNEIAVWLTLPGKPWPACYFVYARLAAELGVAGLVMWIVLWIWLARRVLIASLNYQRATGLVPPAAYPLIASCFCVLFLQNRHVQDSDDMGDARSVLPLSF